MIICNIKQPIQESLFILIAQLWRPKSDNQTRKCARYFCHRGRKKTRACVTAVIPTQAWYWAWLGRCPHVGSNQHRSIIGAVADESMYSSISELEWEHICQKAARSMLQGNFDCGYYTTYWNDSSSEILTGIKTLHMSVHSGRYLFIFIKGRKPATSKITSSKKISYQWMCRCSLALW